MLNIKSISSESAIGKDKEDYDAVFKSSRGSLNLFLLKNQMI